MKKAVLYVRVSSKEQRDEGYSIPAQKKLLRAYAKKHALRVVQEFEDAETAKRAGRREFERMLRLLRADPSIQHVLVEKTDRLSRNFRDLVTIDDLGRTLHFVKDGQVIGSDAKSSDKFIYNIKVVMAKNYIDNLSEETRKGMLEKAEQGLYPSFAPLGYLNNRETGGVDVDFRRAPAIRELFELYAGRGVSVRDLARIANERGLRTRKGKRLVKSGIAQMLANPIYTGDFVWKGVYYKGRHDPILPRDLFERVQARLTSKAVVRKKTRVFAFRGLVRCGCCGCLITAEEKKGRYVYYRCTRSRGNCVEKPIREEDLARLLCEPLKRLRVTPERVRWIEDALRQSFADEKHYHETETRRLRAEYDALETKINLLYEDKLDGTISVDFWKRKSNEYVCRQNKIEDYLGEHRAANIDYLANRARILELAQHAYSLYLVQEPFEQRKLLDLLLSNCTLKGGRVECELAKPFDTLADGAEQEERFVAQNLPFAAANKIWLPKLDSNRPLPGRVEKERSVSTHRELL